MNEQLALAIEAAPALSVHYAGPQPAWSVFAVWSPPEHWMPGKRFVYGDAERTVMSNERGVILTMDGLALAYTDGATDVH